MTCKQLGGASDLEFHANSFDEIAEDSKNHAMDMLEKNDPAHINAMDKMRQLMKTPKQWRIALKIKEWNLKI